MSYDPSSSVFGQYREDLANLAQSQEKKKQKKDAPSFQRLRTFVTRGGDWFLLGILGITMALFAYIIEGMIKYCYHRRDEMLGSVSNFWLKFFIWIIFPLVLMTIAMVIVRVLSPQAAGSGVAEMKVILRGVVLKEYLSFPTLVAKVLSLPLVIGSGLPLGKDVSFVTSFKF
jgi:chloride channel 2